MCFCLARVIVIRTRDYLNSNRQKIQSDLSYNITTEKGATDTTGLRTEHALLYLIKYCT